MWKRLRDEKDVEERESDGVERKWAGGEMRERQVEERLGRRNERREVEERGRQKWEMEIRVDMGWKKDGGRKWREHKRGERVGRERNGEEKWNREWCKEKEKDGEINREESKNGQWEKKKKTGRGSGEKRDGKGGGRKDRNLMTSLQVLLPGHPGGHVHPHVVSCTTRFELKPILVATERDNHSHALNQIQSCCKLSS